MIRGEQCRRKDELTRDSVFRSKAPGERERREWGGGTEGRGKKQRGLADASSRNESEKSRADWADRDMDARRGKGRRVVLMRKKDRGHYLENGNGQGAEKARKKGADRRVEPLEGALPPCISHAPPLPSSPYLPSNDTAGAAALRSCICPSAADPQGWGLGLGLITSQTRYQRKYRTS